jgi:hypothetical protein
VLPVVVDLRCPSLKDRHWDQIEGNEFLPVGIADLATPSSSLMTFKIQKWWGWTFGKQKISPFDN